MRKTQICNNCIYFGPKRRQMTLVKYSGLQMNGTKEYFETDWGKCKINETWHKKNEMCVRFRWTTVPRSHAEDVNEGLDYES